MAGKQRRLAAIVSVDGVACRRTRLHRPAALPASGIAPSGAASAVPAITACTVCLCLLALAGCSDCSRAGSSMDSPPGMSQAPSVELARCEQLYAQFWRYRSTGGESPQGSSYQGIVEADAAVDSCRRGNTKEGIAVLKRKVGAGGCG